MEHAACYQPSPQKHLSLMVWEGISVRGTGSLHIWNRKPLMFYSNMCYHPDNVFHQEGFVSLMRNTCMKLEKPEYMVY